MYNIRNKEGYLTAKVNRRIAVRLQREYMGVFRLRNYKQIWEFKEQVSFGDGEIFIVMFPGSFIELE
jgi:hypothetical protein